MVLVLWLWWEAFLGCYYWYLQLQCSWWRHSPNLSLYLPSSMLAFARVVFLMEIFFCFFLHLSSSELAFFRVKWGLCLHFQYKQHFLLHVFPIILCTLETDGWWDSNFINGAYVGLVDSFHFAWILHFWIWNSSCSSFKVWTWCQGL